MSKRAAELDKLAPDLWLQAATLQWGRYISQIETEAVGRALSQFACPGKALDIGAEQGRWTRMLLDRGWQVTSTEICSKKLADCQIRNPEATCVLMEQDAMWLPADECSIDIVTSIEVPISEQPWFVCELHRVLRPAGIAVFTMNNRSSYRATLSNANSRRKGESLHYCSRYVDVRRQLLEMGFLVLHEEAFCWLPFSRFSDSWLIPILTPLEKAMGLHRLVRFGPWIVVVCQKAQSQGDLSVI